ncbi:hypothetical protein GYMLUDRAFT_182380 [Collybiopsis luxurians FD-317 M1]|uniref:NACHT domain-containing protein n=1 Tax=Collybiopsis luxurians FD-317 M1 TaxID=944289 RepID=A0A0D0BZ78_9AGAR|nr:hypothetical protein GYMLUDRAFT_182380 [Collybiopsis luxurians FD-317 M1]
MLHLDNWPISHSALYDADAGPQISRNRCTENTRVDILKTIEDWVVDPSDDSPPVFWLRGMAGMGKSTIAYSICHQFDSQEGDHHLGASFFCSRQSENLRKRRNIIPTIVRRLAYYSAPFAEALSGIDPNMAYAVDKQLENLLIEPWHKSAQKQLKERLPVLVVIDALDEIEAGEGSRFIEELITSINYAGPNVHGIKFLVTSRPDPDIVRTCKQLKVEASYRLEDVEPATAINDVRRFLQAELPEFDKTEATSLDVIAQQSKGVFIYASTAVRYISPKGSHLSPKQMHARLTAIASDKPSTSHLGNEELLVDILYKQIVNEALGDRGKLDVFRIRKQVLHMIAVAQQPVTPTAISHLISENDMDSDPVAVEKSIEALHAVAYVSEIDGCVYIYHKSFLDFLLDPKRAGEEIVCNAASQHGVITRHCFAIMNLSLKFNMCNLPSSFLLDSEIADLEKIVAGSINNSLRYCCLFWADHLMKALQDIEEDFLNLLNEFGEIKAIFWIEVMNLLGTGRRSYETMRTFKQWLSKKGIGLEHHLSMITALERLTQTFTGSPARLSTPHLYISSLATELATSKVPSTWRDYFPHLPQVVCEGVSNQSGAKMRINTGSCVNSVAFSNDGLRIVSGLSDNTVCIWDVDTGVKVQALEGHSGSVQSVAPSYDGSCIVTGSTDKSVRIWDVNTGMNLQTLEGHNGAVMSVAFSSDGSRIVSGSKDETISIWDANSGRKLQSLKGHRGEVRSVAFSNDGLYIASGSSDQTVHIWDAHTGVNLQILEGHEDWVRSVAFSHDGSRLVSGSDDGHICIWNAETWMKLQTLDGHINYVTSVTFSNDGSRIISSSYDRTVCIWDASSGEKLHTLEGHNSATYSVAFSSDGYHIVSGSVDQTICIWDVNPGVSLHTLPGHKDSVNSVAYSNDGLYIVSGSNDHTVCIWDANAGVCLQTLEGHTGSVLSVAFSIDGSHIVSGSRDTTVHIWDAKTGVTLHTLEGHRGKVNSVAFSKDGSYIVSGSTDKTICTWNANTGVILQTLEGHTELTVRIWDANSGRTLKTLEGHTEAVQSVAFSNDGLYIASGSSDQTVRIWDAHTGVKLRGLEGHTNWVWSVAFSNDSSRIVSGSSDETVRIWDAITGVNLHTLEGHKSSVGSVAFSNDGSCIVSGSDDQTVRIWDAKTGSGWLFDCDSSHPNCIMWLPPPLIESLPIYPCLNILSRYGHTFVTYDPDFVGTNWMNCYSPTGTK